MLNIYLKITEYNYLNPKHAALETGQWTPQQPLVDRDMYVFTNHQANKKLKFNQ